MCATYLSIIMKTRQEVGGRVRGKVRDAAGIMRVRESKRLKTKKYLKLIYDTIILKSVCVGGEEDVQEVQSSIVCVYFMCGNYSELLICTYCMLKHFNFYDE